MIQIRNNNNKKNTQCSIHDNLQFKEGELTKKSKTCNQDIFFLIINISSRKISNIFVVVRSNTYFFGVFIFRFIV